MNSIWYQLKYLLPSHNLAIWIIAGGGTQTDFSTFSSKKVIPFFEFFWVVFYIKDTTFLFEVTVMDTLIYGICLGIMLGIFDYLENKEQSYDNRRDATEG